MDRFLLVGTVLQPKLEVRYQRSRNKNRPASRTDGLGATDLDGRAFIEPTQELRFLPAPDHGRFCALLAPTSVADSYRWQLFTADEADGVLWSYSIEQAADGLFNTAGSQAWTCTDHPDVFAAQQGTCARPSVTDATALCGKSLIPALEHRRRRRVCPDLRRPGCGRHRVGRAASWHHLHRRGLDLRAVRCCR